MFRFMRDCLAVAAVFALCIWSLEPIALLPFGLCAAGLGIGALFMHIAADSENVGQPAVVVTAPTRTVFVSPQPTYVSSWSWNPANWFSGWGADRHYGHHTHGHTSPSVFDRPTHAVVTNPYRASSNVHVAHSSGGPFFSPAPAHAHATVSSNNAYTARHSNEHGHR